MNTTAKLLLHCPDQPGILAEVTNFITINKGNIVYLDQYVDHVENIFFMRIEWEIKDFFIPKDKIEELALKDAEIGVWYRKLFEASLIESQVKADTLRFEPAHERYNKLLQLHPEILKRAPLVYIASLLQMTPETLSRVRSASLNG